MIQFNKLKVQTQKFIEEAVELIRLVKKNDQDNKHSDCFHCKFLKDKMREV